MRLHGGLLSETDPSGEEGKITLKINTTGYGGGVLSKKATVYTNDKKRPNFTLAVTGDVERFALIQPARVILRGAAGSPIHRSVKIIPVEKYPFKILEAKARDGKNIRFELSEIADNPKGGYVLEIENTRPGKGRYFDYIALKTTSKVKSEIKIGIYGFIQNSKQADD